MEFMWNRRECIRCELLGVPLEPSPVGETVDVSETGIAWISGVPFIRGEVVRLESPALFDALELPWTPIAVRVRDLEQLDDDHWRIGAEFIAPTNGTVVALRRAMLRLQRQGNELDSHIVDVLVLPHA